MSGNAQVMSVDADRHFQCLFVFILKMGFILIYSRPCRAVSLQVSALAVACLLAGRIVGHRQETAISRYSELSGAYKPCSGTPIRRLAASKCHPAYGERE